MNQATNNKFRNAVNLFIDLIMLKKFKIGCLLSYFFDKSSGDI